MNLIINLTNDDTEILEVASDASLASYGIGQSRAPSFFLFSFSRPLALTR